MVILRAVTAKTVIGYLNVKLNKGDPLVLCIMCVVWVRGPGKKLANYTLLYGILVNWFYCFISLRFEFKVRK